MRIKDVGPFVLFFLLVCSLLGMALEDKRLIQGLLSTFHLNSASEESYEKLVEELAANCRLELTYLKRIYEDLCFYIPDAPGTGTRKTPNDQTIMEEENMKKAFSMLHPQIKQSLFKCLRENCIVHSISREHVSPSWRHKQLESALQNSNPTIGPKRDLAEATPASRLPSTASLYKLSGRRHSSLKANAPLTSGDMLSVHIRADSEPKVAPEDHMRAIIISCVVTALITLSLATILFVCCHKLLDGGAGDDSKDEKPLLSLSMTDSSSTGSPKDSCCKEKNVSVDGDLSLVSANSGPTNAANIKSVRQSSSVSSNRNGRLSVSSFGLPRLSVSSLGLPRLSVSSAALPRLSVSVGVPFKPAGRVAPVPLEPPASSSPSPSEVDPPTASSPPTPPPPPPPPPPPSPCPKPSAAPPPPPPLMCLEAPPPPPPPMPSATAPPPPPPKASTVAPPPPPPPKASATAPPPPPPPAKRGGAPAGPPPPPPPGKKSGAGPCAPPPPKGAGGPGPPRPPPVAVRGDTDASKAKLKPFFWDKVLANPNHAMVWHHIKSGSFQFNEEMIESLFGYTPTENKIDKNKKESSSVVQSPKFIQIIDQKKSQNLSILLRALNVTIDEVRDAIQEGDFLRSIFDMKPVTSRKGMGQGKKRRRNELPPELIDALLRMAPTVDEELKLRLYSGSLAQLGPADRFLKILVDIPFAFKRLEVLLFMGTLQEDYSTIKDSFKTLEAACEELKSSRLFLKLLEAVLKTGNRMNSGTYRGGAQAFKLDTLLKLADVKGTDGKTTLLHFVVQEIVRSEGIRAVRVARESRSFSSVRSEDLMDDTLDESEEHYRALGLQTVSGLGDQLENVRRAASLDAESLTGTIAKLGCSLVKAKNFINKEMVDVVEDNGFLQALKSFVPHAEAEVAWLLEEEKKIMMLIRDTADYFHGNSGKEEGLRLFVIVRDFLIMLEKVCREVKDRPWLTKPKKKEPPSRQSSTETTPRTPFSPDIRQKLFPAIAQQRQPDSSSSSSSSDDD